MIILGTFFAAYFVQGVRKFFVRIFNKAERNLKKERTKQKRKEREIYNVNEDKGISDFYICAALFPIDKDTKYLTIKKMSSMV